MIRSEKETAAPDMDERSTESLAARLRHRRRPHGIAAALMPFRASGAPDFDGFAAQLARIDAAGLQAAVNMDTGYVQSLSPAQRAQALVLARQTLASRDGGPAFVA